MQDWSAVVVVPRGEQFAVVARGFAPKNVNFPGGDRLAEDQTPVDTAVRELREETGLLTTPEYLRLMSVWTGSRGQRVYAYFATGFVGRLRSGSEGKAFWTAQLPLLLAPTSDFHKEQRALLQKLMRLSA
jgi:8-oxo-dGTP pyrophosphatase MutT (NUDIX family)